jgi:hypothetical protein
MVEVVHRAIADNAVWFYKLALAFLVIDFVGALAVFFFIVDVGHVLQTALGFFMATWIWPVGIAGFFIVVGPFTTAIDRQLRESETFEKLLLNKLDSIEGELQAMRKGKR